MRADCLPSYPNSYHTCNDVRPRVLCMLSGLCACLHMLPHKHTHTHAYWQDLTLHSVPVGKAKQGFGARVFPLRNGHTHIIPWQMLCSAFKGQTIRHEACCISSLNAFAMQRAHKAKQGVKCNQQRLVRILAPGGGTSATP